MNAELLVILAAHGITDDPTTDPQVLAEVATDVLDDLERDVVRFLEGIVGTDPKNTAARRDARALLGTVRAERAAR